MASNGEVEGPADASGRTPVERSSPGVPDAAERAPRARNLLQRPRRRAAGAQCLPAPAAPNFQRNAGPLERLLEVTLTDHHCARAALVPQGRTHESPA